MPHLFSYAVSMNLEHSIKEGSHERYPDHLQCFRNIKKIKYPDFQGSIMCVLYDTMYYNVICNSKYSSLSTLSSLSWKTSPES